MRALREIQTLKDRLCRENVALKEEVDKASMFEEIVGESPALGRVLALVAKVAPTDSTVLITGETGTGKELIARAIHRRSQRAARAVRERQLRRHPAGADRVGALRAREGRVHRRDAAPPRPVRAGRRAAPSSSTRSASCRWRPRSSCCASCRSASSSASAARQPIRADVRVIAATNRDLARAAIAAGTFRSDLFYRLNVFPIEVPPLRERREDIPLLVEYFLTRYARKAGQAHPDDRPEGARSLHVLPLARQRPRAAKRDRALRHRLRHGEPHG